MKRRVPPSETRKGKSCDEVVVVGSFMQDLVYRCDEFPLNGETVIGSFTTGAGGKGSNQAIAAGRAGVRTLFVGAVGADMPGRAAVAFYRREKIGCRFIAKGGANTGSAVILVNRRGQNQIVIAPGANLLLAPADIPPALLRGVKVLVTQLESNPASTARVLRRARQAGVTTVLNPAPMGPGFDPALLRDVDILIPNETEFAALTRGSRKLGASARGEKRGARMHALCRALGVPTIIVTLGGKGCLVSQPSGFYLVPAHRGLNVVDTTGAGDAFCGGFAAGLVHFRFDIDAAVRFGTAVAALSVTRPGAAAAMPNKREILEFLRRKRLREPARLLRRPRRPLEGGAPRPRINRNGARSARAGVSGSSPARSGDRAA